MCQKHIFLDTGKPMCRILRDFSSNAHDDWLSTYVIQTHCRQKNKSKLISWSSGGIFALITAFTPGCLTLFIKHILIDTGAGAKVERVGLAGG